jgi:hypothetical protein
MFTKKPEDAAKPALPPTRAQVASQGLRPASRRSGNDAATVIGAGLTITGNEAGAAQRNKLFRFGDSSQIEPALARSRGQIELSHGQDPVPTSQHASGFALPALFDQLCLIFRREVRTKDPVSVFGDRLSLTA